MATKRIGKNQRPYFQKAKDSALLAVEVYNKPAVKFKSEGYIALMVMAWTALMHAIFLRKGKSPYYKGANGQWRRSTTLTACWCAGAGSKAASTGTRHSSSFTSGCCGTPTT